MTAITATEQPSKRKRAVVVGLAAVVLTAGIAGAAFQSTGAWFTASKTASGNSVTAGTLSLGNLGDNNSELVTATNAFPMTDAQATAATSTAATATINVRNTGTLALDYSIALSNYSLVKATGVTATLDDNKVKVAYKLNNVWTTTTLKSFIAAPPAGLVNPGTDLAAGESAQIPLRVYFDSTASNDYQGAKVTFNATANAIQTNQQ